MNRLSQESIKNNAFFNTIKTFIKKSIRKLRKMSNTRTLWPYISGRKIIFSKHNKNELFTYVLEFDFDSNLFISLNDNF